MPGSVGGGVASTDDAHDLLLDRRVVYDLLFHVHRLKSCGGRRHRGFDDASCSQFQIEI